MKFETYNRNPFTVEALLITEENLEEVAPLIGDIRTKGKQRYIAVNSWVVPHVTRVYVGWWVTKVDNTLRCYSPKAFSEQFSLAEKPEDLTETLVQQANHDHSQYLQWEARTFPSASNE
jgi:hypothetical protein